MVSICIRASRDIVRKRKREKDFLDEYSDDSLSTDNTVEAESQTICRDTKIETVKKALMSLPDRLRTILSLHLIEGYDYEEIEGITGLNGNTIRSRYMRGRERLAFALKTMIKE
jgi:RNA polymerase sigma factor (sigma-70 family)